MGSATSPFVPAGRPHTSLLQQQLDWPSKRKRGQGDSSRPEPGLLGFWEGNKPQLRLDLGPLPEPPWAWPGWCYLEKRGCTRIAGKA